MDFKTKNLGPLDDISVKGPRVDISIEDAGQGNVALTLRLADGTLMHYPSGQGKVQTQTVTMARGKFDAVVVSSVVELPGFGGSYDTRIKVNGILVLSAKGKLAAGRKHETGLGSFLLEVV